MTFDRNYDKEKRHLKLLNTLELSRGKKKHPKFKDVAFASFAFFSLAFVSSRPAVIQFFENKAEYIHPAIYNMLNKYDDSIRIAVIDSDFNLSVLKDDFPDIKFVDSPALEYKTISHQNHGTRVISTILGHIKRLENSLPEEYRPKDLTIIPINHRDIQLTHTLNFAYRYKPDIINISLAIDSMSEQEYNNLYNVLQYARDNNILVIVAAGNLIYSDNYPFAKFSEDYLSLMPNVFCIGSVTPNKDEISSFCRMNGSADLYDIGENILTLNNSNEEQVSSGTSFSVPRDVACSAIIKYILHKKNIDPTPTQIENVLLNTAKKIDNNVLVIDEKAAFKSVIVGSIPNNDDLKTPHVVQFNAVNKGSKIFINFKTCDNSGFVDTSSMSVSACELSDEDNIVTETPVKYSLYNNECNIQIDNLRPGRYLLAIRNLKDASGNVLKLTYRYFNKK